ncbi:MAG: hypothetical protein Q9206_001935 [Seirophora lacunosa]|nr:MAG: hypothetical protein LQ344_000139 [Seirophora lacunosa]
MNRDQAPRTLTTGVTVPGDAAAMTVALCTAACQSRNFLYAGLDLIDLTKHGSIKHCFIEHRSTDGQLGDFYYRFIQFCY